MIYSGSILPAPDLRWCGLKFKDHAFYLQSAENEAKRLGSIFGCDKDTKVLDIGCGQGRLPIGILRVIGELNYIGIDVDEKSITWCKKYIEKNHPSFRFQHLDVANERYNPRGHHLGAGFKFDLPKDSFGIIYLYSVFSHMREKDMRLYLSDFLRLLEDDGKVFFTTFVEEQVPNISINPDGYVHKKCSGKLLVVRYEKSYLFSILDEIGFMVERFSHRTEDNGQSGIYLRKKA